MFDQGQRFLQISPSFQVAVGDSGNDAFWAIRNGNGTFQVQEAATNNGDGVISPASVTDLAAWQAGTKPYTITIDAVGDYTVTDGGGAVVANGPYVSGADIGFDGIQVTIVGAPAAGDTFTVAPSTNQDVFTTIQNLVAKQFHIGVDLLTSRSRKKRICHPRQIAMYLCRKLTNEPLDAIGRAFGRDHASVIHSIGVVERRIREKAAVRREVDFLVKKLTGQAGASS